MAHQLKPGMVDQVPDILPRAGKEIIDTQDIVALGEQALAQVGAQESGAASDKRSRSDRVFQFTLPASEMEGDRGVRLPRQRAAMVHVEPAGANLSARRPPLPIFFEASQIPIPGLKL